MMNRLMTLAAIVAFTTVATAQSATQSGTQAAPAKPDAAKSKTLTDLQGAWVLTTANGNDTAGQPEIVLAITDNKYVQTVNGDVVERGTFKLDETKKPIQVDLMIGEGQDAGKTQLGVMELSGGVLKAKLSIAGETTRPTDFAPADEGFAFTAVKKK